MASRIWNKDFVIGIIITLMVISLNYISIDNIQKLMQRVEGILYDTRLLITLPFQQRSYDEQILIIDIDEKSMREQGRYPWSRSTLSDLVNNLLDAGVIVIAFDVFFAEQERNPVDEILNKAPELPPAHQEKLRSIAKSIDADELFAHTIQSSDTVLGFLFDNNAISTGVTPLPVIPLKHESLAPTEVIRYQAVLGNIPILQNAAAGAGFINSVPDSDGFIRKASLVLQYQNQLYPSLALEAARVYTLSDKINIKVTENKGEAWLQGVKFGKHFIPTNEKGQILIPYKGKKGSFPYISATDVLNSRVDAAILEGAIVFIGTSAIGLADLRTTSVGVQYPGVEIHANVFEGLLHPEILPTEPDTSLAILFSLLTITGVVLSFYMHTQGPIKILVISFISLIIHLSLNGYLWIVQQVSLPLFQLLFLVILLSSYYGIVGFIIESKNRKHIKNMFDQYVPPAYIEKIMRTKKGLDLKSESRVMTVLFADIRNFTTISEGFSAQELSEFMREYLSLVTEIIFKHHGTIDKYVGDMVMAFWNAPIDDKEHATNAVLTGMAMNKLTAQLTEDFHAKGWPAIQIGVGISTGKMNVGDMGSSYRKAYTVLGDAVNLGARLEALTKTYQVDVLISETTYLAISRKGILCREIDTVTVKGKTEPVTIYQPFADQEKCNEALLMFLDDHKKALQHYKAENWPLALDLMHDLKNSKYLSTKVYDIYIQRINAKLLADISEDNSGIFTNYLK